MIGFVDDTLEKQGTKVHGYSVYGRDALLRWPEVCILAIPGNPTSYRMRKPIIESLGIGANRFATVIHPSATVSPLAELGRNVLIMAGVVITSNAVVGDHVIHHDVVVDAWSLIGSNVTIAGHTTVGENCYIGSGASIMNGLRVGDGALVGMGSNVIRDVAPGAKIVGNPAHPI
jgi:sugar O-acyltransferase (sialic acid O-acetyltransferase NeuD family)